MEGLPRGRQTAATSQITCDSGSDGDEEDIKRDGHLEGSEMMVGREREVFAIDCSDEDCEVPRADSAGATRADKSSKIKIKNEFSADVEEGVEKEECDRGSEMPRENMAAVSELRGMILQFPPQAETEDSDGHRSYSNVAAFVSGAKSPATAIALVCAQCLHALQGTTQTTGLFSNAPPSSSVSHRGIAAAGLKVESGYGEEEDAFLCALQEACRESEARQEDFHHDMPEEMWNAADRFTSVAASAADGLVSRQESGRHETGQSFNAHVGEVGFLVGGWSNGWQSIRPIYSFGRIQSHAARSA